MTKNILFSHSPEKLDIPFIVKSSFYSLIEVGDRGASYEWECLNSGERDNIYWMFLIIFELNCKRFNSIIFLISKYIIDVLYFIAFF